MLRADALEVAGLARDAEVHVDVGGVEVREDVRQLGAARPADAASCISRRVASCTLPCGPHRR